VRLSKILVAPLLLISSLWASAQTPPRKADSVVGEVTAIDQRQVTLKPDTGGTVVVSISDGASLLRAQPGATSLTDASPLALEELAVGDRVLVRGRLSEDKASLAARQVVVMTRGDIAQKREAEQADWRKRGILGTVTAIDAQKGEITLQPRRFGTAGPMVLPTANRKIGFRRYASGSVKFADAKKSSLSEVKVGDQLRALGERNPDGTTFLAEQIVFGTFRTIVGDVVAIDAAKGELAIKGDESGDRLSVSVGPDARLRRLPPEMAARLAAPREGGAPPGSSAPGGGPGGAPAANVPPGASSSGAAGGGGWGGRREGGGGSEDLLERLPVVTLAELKAGDRILVASTSGPDASRVNAIAVVSGLEALRAAAPAGNGRRMGRGPEVGLPADLMDLGMGLQ
jgi:hypothetical protein